MKGKFLEIDNTLIVIVSGCHRTAFQIELAFVLLHFLFFRLYQQFYLFGWFNKRALEALIFLIPLSKDNPTRFYNNAVGFLCPSQKNCKEYNRSWKRSLWERYINLNKMLNMWKCILSFNIGLDSLSNLSFKSIIFLYPKQTRYLLSGLSMNHLCCL